MVLKDFKTMLENINNNIKNIFSKKDFLFSERQSSYERFLNLGLPNKRIEDWKYTGFSKLNRFLSQDILDVTFRLKKEHDQDVEILDLDFSKIDSNDYIKPQNYVKNEAVIDLNLAFSSQFKVIDIKNSQKKPIVIFLDTTEEGMFLPRIYINVFEGVSAEILIINAGLKGFINQLVEFNLHKNAKLIVNRVNFSETDFIETFSHRYNTKTHKLKYSKFPQKAVWPDSFNNLMNLFYSGVEHVLPK